MATSPGSEAGQGAQSGLDAGRRLVVQERVEAPLPDDRRLVRMGGQVGLPVLGRQVRQGRRGRSGCRLDHRFAHRLLPCS